jgi:hypothetical protein
MHITEDLLGMSAIALDFVLGNGDNCHNTDDRNCSQQFLEREPCRILVG